MHATFEVSSFNHSRDMDGSTNRRQTTDRRTNDDTANVNLSSLKTSRVT